MKPLKTILDTIKSVISGGNVNVSGTLNDGGTDITGSAMPAGGSGLKGWLSAIYTLATTGAGLRVIFPSAQAVTLATAPTTSVRVSVNAGDGATTYHTRNSTAGTNATLVKSTGAQIAFLFAYNNSLTVKYLKIFNQTTAPTVGTNTPVFNIPIKPNDHIILQSNGWVRLGTGFSYAITGGPALLDNTAIAADEVFVTANYT